MLNDLYFKTTSNIRPYFVGPIGGLKIEGPLYFIVVCNSSHREKQSVLCNLGRQVTHNGGISHLVVLKVILRSYSAFV